MTDHESAIQKLVEADPALLRRRFRVVVRKTMCHEGEDWPAECFPWDEIDGELRFQPDAFKIDGRELHCYEVVDSCKLNADRRLAYSIAFQAFEAWDRKLRLWVCDVYGNKTEQDLEQWYFDELRKDHVSHG